MGKEGSGPAGSRFRMGLRQLEPGRNEGVPNREEQTR